MSIEDFTNESGINNEMISKDSLLSDYKFTEALSFDQEYEGVPGGNILFGGMQVRKKKYTDDTAGIWQGIDSDGDAKLNMGDATNYVKWDGSALTITGLILNYTGAIASDVLQQSADTVREDDSDAYIKVKEIITRVGGTIRVKFDLAENNNSTSGFGKIYVNGVATGTERQSTGSSYVTFSEDFTVNAFDLIQLYIKDTSGSATDKAQVKNFRLYFTVSSLTQTSVITD